MFNKRKSIFKKGVFKKILVNFIVPKKPKRTFEFKKTFFAFILPKNTEQNQSLCASFPSDNIIYFGYYVKNPNPTSFDFGRKRNIGTDKIRTSDLLARPILQNFSFFYRYHAGLVVTTENYWGLLHKDLLRTDMWLLCSIDRMLLRKLNFAKH